MARFFCCSLRICSSSSFSSSDVASLLGLERRRSERRNLFTDLVVLVLVALVHVDVLAQDVLLLMECNESFLDEVSDVLDRVEMLGRLVVLMG